MAILLSSCVLTGKVTTTTVASDDPDIDPFNVREEGCPIVSERNKLDVNKVLQSYCA